ncbi:hypothetical protein PR001_g25252 [Phytophthora rubi]|uniref:Uncharacterized protein n=1 Tax=Phytophthora rubi TaxID=129364 RepID=A0A6A3I3W3_9STRA|nr:hypothetical protein PR002_g25546 [Phytophthora rubi]KAE8977005.1 hypothetical protein PR001_g25252 [Phytophthora rubi]
MAKPVRLVLSRSGLALANAVERVGQRSWQRGGKYLRIVVMSDGACTSVRRSGEGPSSSGEHQAVGGGGDVGIRSRMSQVASCWWAIRRYRQRLRLESWRAFSAGGQQLCCRHCRRPCIRVERFGSVLGLSGSGSDAAAISGDATLGLSTPGVSRAFGAGEVSSAATTAGGVSGNVMLGSGAFTESDSGSV